ncbi:hypothetical protein [Sulfurimonas sp. HSL3-7]|uniref:hypothetical protein n=1 Tax=Sulfonitrofixus jiaomeiensis TaxID=3131938 RepID=UPI0031FA3BFE
MAKNEKFVSTIVLSSLTAALLTLSGCGSSSSSSSSTPTPTPTVEAELYDGSGALDAMERHVANDGVISATTFASPVTTALPAPVAPTRDAAAQAAATVLTGDIIVDTTLDAATLWKINGLVKVKDGATLTIEPGTVIFGEAGANYIVVTKGSKIIADGTEASPIIFTSATALLNPADAAPAQWGGLTVLGGAPTNHDAPFYEVDETDADFAFGAATAGAGDAADNSGILRNVYILNSGKEVATDLEINGLSLAGVGSGTVVENIYVENSSDDCIEIWGGTVNVTNATLKNCNDDSLDLDYGYVGTADNIVVEQVNAAHAGFEISSGGDTPMTGAEIKNFRIVKVDGSDEGGIYIKDDSTAPIFGNGTVTTVGALDAGIHTKKAFVADQKGQIAFRNVTLTASVDFDGSGAADVQEKFEAQGGTISLPAPVAPTRDAAAQAAATVLTGDIIVDTTLDAATLWKINGLVKVKDGATLTIEPGTVIFGEAGANYIVVTKGSKIIADGTEASPIIFTSATALLNPADAAPAQWGGLTVLGGAPTNHDAPFYEVDETDADFAFGAATAGAGDAADNSGILRNVYILNSGKEVATDLEINGLSLAGVGSGTVVENIYVENSSDDCIEIWGGTVNVTNATLKNCNDDSLDLDYGYVGTADNIVVEQVNAAHAGFEISSGGDTPMTGAEIKNFRIVKVDGSDEGGIYIKDDSTAPIFGNGFVTAPGIGDAAIHTKKAFVADQKAAIAFKDVYLK